MAAALLIQRLSIAAFLAVWTSLKFYRPEWMRNVYKDAFDPATLGLDWAQTATIAGVAQAVLVALFALGLFRTPVYGLVVLMHGAGVVTAAMSGRLAAWTMFPNNLLWTSVATLGALVALFLMRAHDRYSVDGLLRRRRGRR